jgi:predicted nucleic acid-binding protein
VTRYLLDTDAPIDFSKGSEPATSRILSWIDATDIVAVCAISVAEFFAGLPLSIRPRLRTIGAINDPELHSDELEDRILPPPPAGTDR